MATSNFWSTYGARRIARRRLLQAASVGGAVAGAALVVGCGGEGKKASSGQTATAIPAPTSEAQMGTDSRGATHGGTYHAATSLAFDTFDPHLSVGGSQVFF